MRVPAGGSAADRLKAMTETKSGAGTLLIQPTPEEAARAIYDYLLDKRLIEAAWQRGNMSDIASNLSQSGKPVN